MPQSDSSEDERPFNPRDDWEEESDEDSLRPNKRRKTKGSTTLRTRGLAFVQKTAEVGGDGQFNDHTEEQEDDVDDERPTMGTMRGFGIGQFPADSPMRSPTPNMASSPEPEKRVGAGESAFGKGSKVNQNSFAARMMTKMGHKEGQGLGKSGQGIAAPIQAQKVQAGTGLGFGAQEQRPAKSVKNLKDTKTGKLAGSITQPRLEAPRKKRYEVAAIESRGLHVPDVLRDIIDATGAEHRKLDDLSGYSTPTSDVHKPATEEEKQHSRLKRDLQLFADAWDGQTAEAEALSQEFTQREAQLEEYTKQAQLFQDLITSFERIAVDDSQQPRPFDQVVLRLQDIQQSYADYIEPLELPELAVSTLSQPLTALNQDWEPLSDLETANTFVSQLTSISVVTDLGRIKHSRRHRRRTTALESLLLKTVYPKVRDALRSEWSPFDPLAAVGLLDILYPALLPPWMVYNLLQEVVVPRLLEGVRKFRPPSSKHSSNGHNDRKRRKDIPDLHEWLFDWWNLIDSLDVEAFHNLKVEVKSKVRFDERVWPKWEQLLGSRHKPAKKAQIIDSPAASTPIDEVEEITFKDIFEEWCAENDLMLKNTGTSDDLGRRLQRLQLAAGRGQGMLVYVQNDVVFDAASDDPYGLDDELVSRVKNGR